MDGKSGLARLASESLGVFTLDEARSAGISRHQLDRAVRSGEVRRLFPNVFADAAAPSTWRQEVLAAVRAGGPRAAASHRTAVALHGLGGRRVPARPIEISIPASECRRVKDVVVHRVLLPAEHVVRVGPIPVTSVARSLCDATGFRTEEQLGAMVDDAFVRSLVDRTAIEQVLEVLESCPGRRLARMRTVLAARGPEIERAESRPEMRVYRAIVAGGLPAPEMQHWVVVRGERFRLDFAYPHVRLGLEYLGFGAHGTRSALSRDTRRRRLLTLDGWEILEFTAEDSDETIVRDVGLRLKERSALL